MRELISNLSPSADDLTTDALERIVTAEASHLFVAPINDQIVGTLTLVTFAIPAGIRA